MATATQVPHRAEVRLKNCTVASRQLVRVRCTEQAVNEELNSAIRDAFDWGATIDMLSEATGYPPKAIKRIVGQE